MASKISINILIALLLGVGCGLFFPSTGEYLNFFSEAFVNLLRLLIGPIVFCSVVIGIGQHKDLKKASRIGLKAIIYFEVITTIALIVAMLIAHVVKPGEGLDLQANIYDNVSTDTAQVTNQDSNKTVVSKAPKVYQELLDMIPNSLFKPFVEGNLLHILFIAVLFGVALALMKESNTAILKSVETFNQLLFKILHLIIYMAPIAVFGAMSYTVGKFGLHTLINLGELVLLVFCSCFCFIFIFLSLVCRLMGLRLSKILYYIKEEIILTLGTSSSEVVLPQLMEKLVKKGCDKETVALVLPTGYSFNLDGMSIYLGIVIIFLAQAYGVDLSFKQELMIIGFTLLISKGSAAVTGAGFITLTAVITATKILPIEGLALLLSVDRFMSMARSMTNMIGNVVATVIIDSWEHKGNRKLFDH